MSGQTLIVALIVACAALYVARRGLQAMRASRATKSGCGTDCGCGTAGTTTAH
jgi:hypothetical protein